MRKYVSLKTLETARANIADAIQYHIGKPTPETPDILRNLFTADTELTEAIAAATKEPTPRVTAKRSRLRKIIPADFPKLGTTEPQL